MKLRLAVAALALAAAGCAAESPYVPPPFTGEPTPVHPPEEAWARVLKACVDEQGRVDFPALMQNHKDLDLYVAWIYERSPQNWANLYPTKAHAVAYHLNAYNALSLYNLLQSGAPASLSLLDRRKFFEKRKLLVGGQPLTLQQYKDDVIRGLGDARALFAVTSLMGHEPGLQRAPYRAQVLDQQLDRAARAFFADPRHLRVDDAGRRIVLSPLLKAYQQDFLRDAASLPAYAAGFRDAGLPEAYSVEFAAEDWNVGWRRR